MRRACWIFFALAACGHASDFSLQQAALAGMGVVAEIAGRALIENSEPPAPRRVAPGSSQPPAAQPPRPVDPDLYTVSCGPGRHYRMFWPVGGTVWSCYFETSEARRFSCDEQTGAPPSELVEWCKEPGH